MLSEGGGGEGGLFHVLITLGSLFQSNWHLLMIDGETDW